MTENPNIKFLEDIRKQAADELNQEDFRFLVNKEKARMREHTPFWHRIFPFVITRRRK